MNDVAPEFMSTELEHPWQASAMTTDQTQYLSMAARPAGLDGPIYLDHNATTPVDPRVLEAMLPYLRTHFGNPSSDHPFASSPRAAVAQARVQVGALIGARAEEITFMGSGSEADATAIRGVVTAVLTTGVQRPHLITQATEHPAVLAACQYAERFHGAEVTVLAVGRDGLLDPDVLASAIRPTTVLVSVMHANNETGVIQPIRDLAAIAHAHGALFHTDAAQSVGKIPVDVTDLGVDLLTLVGHKMYAPKGIAALFIRAGTAVAPLIGGGGQEHGRRAGTENVPYLVALGAAAAIAASELAMGASDRLSDLRDGLEQQLVAHLPGRVHLNGNRNHRLPQTLNVSIDGVAGHAILAACVEVAASTGSACHAGIHSASPVLLAMGLPPERGISALRLTLGRWNTREDIVRAAGALARAVRAASPIPPMPPTG
jgi:cysteine desulfurase